MKTTQYDEVKGVAVGIRLARFLKIRFPGIAESGRNKEFGFSNSTVRLWCDGAKIRDDALMKLELLGCNLFWLMTGEGEMVKTREVAAMPRVASQALSPTLLTEIPFPAGARVAANLKTRPVRGLAAADDSGGSRAPDSDDLDDPYWFPEQLVLIPVVGDSMSPVVLPGQYVEIDTEREGFEKDSGIYVVSVLEPGPGDDYPEPISGTFVKCCERRENLYYLTSINSYSPFSVHVDHCRLWPVLGVWFGGKGVPPKGL